MLARFPFAALAITALAGCVTAPAQPASPPLATAALADPAGQAVGSARLTEVAGTLTLEVQARGIAPGAHGIHLHMVGRCDPPGFTSAGAHLNPGGHQHGLENPAGTHLGDLPNLMVGTDGTARAAMTVNGPLAALFDADGTALVIHAAPDDNRTDPSGNSGARIACGVLVRG